VFSRHPEEEMDEGDRRLNVHYGSFLSISSNAGPAVNRLVTLRFLVRRLRQRSGGDIVLLGIALGVTIGMWTAVRLTTFRRLLQWTEVPAGRIPQLDVAGQQRILWAVEAINRRLFPERPCLTQALAARYLLARRGVDSTLRIGVARDSGAPLRAHAWLERNGTVLIGGAKSPDQYRPLDASAPNWSADSRPSAPSGSSLSAD
jgi:hypothetical protein